MDYFSKRIKFFRALRNLSQAELAQAIGISPKQVSDYEVGTSKPRTSTFKKILEALDVTETEFKGSDCLFGNNSGSQQLDMPIAMVLASPSRGQLINITGMELDSPYRNQVNINIYSGTITRTKQLDENYINVYYLTGEKEECIFVHKDNIEQILECMKN